MTTRTDRRVTAAAVEALEGRRLMDGTATLTAGVLTVTGTERKDAIVFALDRDDPATLHVRVNKSTFDFAAADVSSVVVAALGGNDKVVVDERYGRITAPFTVAGGAGNDVVVTGSGDDVVDGGDGNDKLSTGDGDDQCDGGAGNDALAGGGDDDTVLGDAGKDKLDGGAGDDNLDGGGGKDVVRAADATDAVAVDAANPKELKGRKGGPRPQEYHVTDLASLRSDIGPLHEQVVPGSHVERVEVTDAGVVTLHYTFDGDPKLRKTVIDASGTDLQLVTREVSLNELRAPARQQFLARFPGVQIVNAFQRSGGRFDIKYRGDDGVLRETTTDDLVWGLDDADQDLNEDGIFDQSGPDDGGQGGDGQGGGPDDGGLDGGGGPGDDLVGRAR